MKHLKNLDISGIRFGIPSTSVGDFFEPIRARIAQQYQSNPEFRKELLEYAAQRKSSGQVPEALLTLSNPRWAPLATLAVIHAYRVIIERMATEDKHRNLEGSFSVRAAKSTTTEIPWKGVPGGKVRVSDENRYQNGVDPLADLAHQWLSQMSVTVVHQDTEAERKRFAEWAHGTGEMPGLVPMHVVQELEFLTGVRTDAFDHEGLQEQVVTLQKLLEQRTQWVMDKQQQVNASSGKQLAVLQSELQAAREARQKTEDVLLELQDALGNASVTRTIARVVYTFPGTSIELVPTSFEA